ncbi:hypothetical protein [Rhizobium sp. Leaf262]|uniref:hypothetical protein n=1 Tax=Rhizobium sp. Leaf262 TaxID=1736312 RepID=UPI0007128178|nr:hypothetical protein [Rhizobium sp. Leaf262]KQO75125.1 hypothetical protein ASF29_14625 [Rhizobium sp. Leaf262]
MLYPKAMRFVVLFTFVAIANQVNASDHNWRKHLFDFNVSSLNFETDVPVESNVQTVPMGAMEPGTIGSMKIVGKVAPTVDGPQIETTIMAYELLSPPAALPICKYEAEIAGYTPRSIATSPDITEAEVFATQSENGKPKSAILSQCFSKGKNALAIHFIVNIVGEPTKETAKNALVELDAYSSTFLKNLRFSDGKQANFGDDMQPVSLRIGERKIDLQIPRDWEVPINDFPGRLPAELHMVRRSGGKDVGLVWLSVQEMKEKPDLETTGAAIIRDYFVKQTPDADSPILLGGNENSALSENGVANREFRFSVKNRKNEDVGVIDATAVWTDGRLTVISHWSIWAEASRRNEFFSRLPGVTTYNLVRTAVLEVPL